MIGGCLEERGLRGGLVKKKEMSEEDYNGVLWLCSGVSVRV